MKVVFRLARMDKVDLKILGCLRKNARETLTRISKVTGIPISSTFDRLKRLEETGLIARHTSLLDMKKLGLSVRVFLLLKIDDSHKKEVERFLMGTPQVNNLARIVGNWNLVAEVLFQDMKELESFVEALGKDFKGIDFSVHHVLENLKSETFLISYK